ncbi:MAG: VWA domain-containing protein [Oscillospiraceae bacterium]|nr:VWA domain-containing protein [Oscillospiraceae bacterium]
MALDYQVYLEKLALFGRILRQEGLDVSPNETADACRILLELGMADRAVVKTALRTVYAKSRDEQLRFDRVFDSFFLSEDAIRAVDKKHQQQELERAEALREAERELQGESPSLLYNDAQKEAYSQLSEQEKERLRNIKEKFLGDPARNPGLYSSMIHSIFARSIMEQQMSMEDAAMGRMAIDPEIGLMFRDISQFEDHEIPKAVMYIQDIARRINGELTQKRRHTGHTGALDFRRTIRKGLETGGRFYRLAYRRKRSRRKRLVVLCDVSGSMIQFSEFVLRFIQSLNQASESSRVFLFSEEMAEADAFHLQNMDLFRDYVRQSGVYGRGTDLGSALRKLNDMKPPVLSPAAMLLIISDAKTVNVPLAMQEVLRARARAGKVFWLNPIPEGKWKYLNSISTMAELCTMISCSTLEALGQACRKLAFL